MPVHDWTRVSAGTFHDFHNSWMVHLKEALNAGLLPEGYYAQAEQFAGQIEADVLTLRSGNGALRSRPGGGTISLAEAPPAVHWHLVADEATACRLARKTLVIRHASGHEIVALLEIVSPANKDRPSSVQDVVDKDVSALRQGIHLVILDLFPPGPSDPHGINGAIWENYNAAGYDVPANRPLTLGAYAVKKLPDAYFEAVAVGDPLPPMPLFLDPDDYVNVPLEQTYLQAYRGVPTYWRKVVEGDG